MQTNNLTYISHTKPNSTHSISDEGTSSGSSRVDREALREKLKGIEKMVICVPYVLSSDPLVSGGGHFRVPNIGFR